MTKRELEDQAQGLVDLIDYLEEKSIGLEYKCFIDRGRKSKAVIRFYFNQHRRGMLADVIFPYCRKLAQRYDFKVKTDFGMRYPDKDTTTAQYGGRITVKTRRRLLHKIQGLSFGEISPSHLREGLIYYKVPIYYTEIGHPSDDSFSTWSFTR